MSITSEEKKGAEVTEKLTAAEITKTEQKQSTFSEMSVRALVKHHI